MSDLIDKPKLERDPLDEYQGKWRILFFLKNGSVEKSQSLYESKSHVDSSVSYWMTFWPLIPFHTLIMNSGKRLFYSEYSHYIAIPQQGSKP